LIEIARTDERVRTGGDVSGRRQGELRIVIELSTRADESPVRSRGIECTGADEIVFATAAIAESGADKRFRTGYPVTVSPSNGIGRRARVVRLAGEYGASGSTRNIIYSASNERRRSRTGTT
jgi:hypothetical protein